MNTNANHNTNRSLTVAYHDGGRMFAGDSDEFPAGWYLFDGQEAHPVTVLEPFSNTPIVVGDWEGE